MPSASSSNWVQEPVLVLNTLDEPLHVTSGRHAAQLVWRGKAVKLDGDRQPVDNDSQLEAMLPAEPHVIRVAFSGRRFTQVTETPRRSRHDIWERDNGRCQYCNKKLTQKEYEEDHVIPVCHGGTRTWENLVCCCPDCNDEKADRRLDVLADWPNRKPMRLLRTPFKPTFARDLVVMEVRRHVGHRPFWTNFIPEGGPYENCAS